MMMVPVTAAIKYLLVGWITVGLAYLWDMLLRSFFRNSGFRVGFGVPVGEELLKLGACLWFGLAPWLLYALFGLGEGLFDTFHKKRRLHIPLIGAGVATHLVTGLFFLCQSNPVWLNFLLALGIHLLWNNSLLRRQSKNGSAPG